MDSILLSLVGQKFAIPVKVLCEICVIHTMPQDKSNPPRELPVKQFDAQRYLTTWSNRELCLLCGSQVTPSMKGTSIYNVLFYFHPNIFFMLKDNRFQFQMLTWLSSMNVTAMSMSKGFKAEVKPKA